MTGMKVWALTVFSLGVALGAGCGQGPEETSGARASEDSLETRHAGGQTRWVRRGVGSPGDDVLPGDVTTDRDGANIVVGTYEGSPDFGGGPLPAVAAESGANAFIVKYARDGRLLWSHGYGAAAGALFPDTYFEVAATDRQRNITVRGNTSHPVVLGGVTVTGFFLVQFTREGQVRWVRNLGGNYDGSPGLAVDSGDHVILAGAVEGPADFGGGPRTTGPVSAFLVKYTREGTWLWDRVFASPATAFLGGVATDEQDHLYIAGSFDEATDFGGGPLQPSAPGVETAVVARFSPSGQHVWSRTLEDATALSRFSDIAVHGNRVVPVGRFTGRFHFGGRTFIAPAVGSAGMVLALTRDGEDRWGRKLGGNVFQVRSDHEDHMTVLGVAMPGDDVGSGPLPPTSSLYAFVNKYDRVEGARDWVRTFPEETTLFSGLSVSREGEVAVTGGFRGPVDFGTGTLQPTTPDIFDPFLLRLYP
ncbi:hypothetical protein D7X32_04515 [Corallococcus carmarthensis]|uniref:Lipoprotein n=2 Tax=Corallococcus carmarthensis TaxID=2316728 RepID=A0A3A8KEQ8_9BACT|nr:hypothetical protein D7X32_04515 [Corallococcus carmarthensis]